MSKVNLNLPQQVTVIGALYDRANPHDLDEDMLQLTLPTDIVIDVGWYPSWTPTGCYRMIVFQSDVDNQIEPIFATKDIGEILKKIYMMLAKYLPEADARASSSEHLLSILVNGRTTATHSSIVTASSTMTDAGRIVEYA